MTDVGAGVGTSAAAERMVVTVVKKFAAVRVFGDVLNQMEVHVLITSDHSGK